MSDDEFMPNQFQMLSINPFCVISNVPIPNHVRKHNQCAKSVRPVFRWEFSISRDMEASACLVRSCNNDVIYMNSHIQF